MKRPQTTNDRDDDKHRFRADAPTSVAAPRPGQASQLARELYRVLVRLARRGTASITYGALARRLPARIRVHHRNARLYAGLTEVTEACRARGLPIVTAIVWSASTKRPSDGYYKVAHPRLRSLKAQIAAWEAEHVRVLRDAAGLPGAL
jgi:hypothetical protein